MAAITNMMIIKFNVEIFEARYIKIIIYIFFLSIQKIYEYKKGKAIS